MPDPVQADGQDQREATPSGEVTGRRLRVAYVMSRFPKLTETFVLFEMLAVERCGVEVELYPLLREREPVVHPEAVPLVARARYLPFLSRSILRSQAWYLVHAPRRYLGTLRDVVAGTLGSANFLLGGLGIFPKVAHAARLMQADGIEHVHCHFASHPALAGFIVHRLAGIPYSFTAHGSDLHVDRHMLCAKVAAARFVVAISEDNRRVIESECPDLEARIAVVHCGVDPGVFRPRATPVVADAGPLTVACVGTLHEVKGQTVLVEACRILAARGVQVRCRFIGDGPDRARLEMQVRNAGLDGVVEFLGRRSRSEVADILGDADVLVVPSVPTRSGKREGIPVVIMEAMASGLPVVASRLSGIPEIVEDGVNGRLVDPGDATGLADAIAELAADPGARSRLGAQARATVVERFDVATNAARLADLFRAAA